MRGGRVRSIAAVMVSKDPTWYKAEHPGFCTALSSLCDTLETARLSSCTVKWDL